ncbi:hypothetical protein BV898_16100 [Hypsibius exemplaris]|uniref:Uncharacterized protein n=1 Tax=Hypsibius exemplaris TaxID=2072580 RepID=A0A9X6NCL8_HYPEX|nr:hypothetical protein BV898_16100 [Hypsibius exemplaris]
MNQASTADYPSDTEEYGDGDADGENDEDTENRSRESSPCLSSEASFFLETDSSRAAVARAAAAARQHRDFPNQRQHLLAQFPREQGESPPPPKPCARHGSLRTEQSAAQYQQRAAAAAARERGSKTFAKRPNKFDFP